MDLKRISVGLQRDSQAMSKRFTEEALARCSEIKTDKLKSYIARIIKQVEATLQKPTNHTTPEHLLMYSTLLQNFYVTNIKN